MGNKHNARTIDIIIIGNILLFFGVIVNAKKFPLSKFISCYLLISTFLGYLYFLGSVGSLNLSKFITKLHLINISM